MQPDPQTVKFVFYAILFGGCIGGCALSAATAIAWTLIARKLGL